MLNSDTSFDLTQTVTECLLYACNIKHAHYTLYEVSYILKAVQYK